MSEVMHSFEELALETGRFEMETVPNRGVRSESSVLTLDGAMGLGLMDAAEIFICRPENESKSAVDLLSRVGEKVGGVWRAQCPMRECDRSAWVRIFKRPEVIIFVAPLDDRWLLKLTAQFHNPFVATIPPMSLDRSWQRFERDRFANETNAVHVAVGGNRTTATFVGTGCLYGRAVSAAADRPPLMWGYSPEVFKETVRSRRLVFPKSKAQSGSLLA